ncbi:MAG TPA: hypothetical protein VJM57_09670 [Thermodesulfobacteriota bacterium]|nr:hypothetical protein [Thermodesulfobacteriota bacterium]
MERLEAFVLEVLKEVAALPEEAMRLKHLGARLRALEPEEAARFFDILYRRERRDGDTRRVLHILVDPGEFKEALGEGAYKNISHASIRLGLRRVTRLFTDLPPRKAGVYGYDKEEEAKMEFIPLGKRRSLSRTHDQDTIDRLLSDPDPLVIRNILDNTRTLEHQVVKIASKRPNSPVILRLLATHRVWSRRYGVIKAVARNPYSPPRVSVALVELLFTRDVEEIAVDLTLHQQVRQSARDTLTHHPPGGPGGGRPGGRPRRTW